MKSLVLAISVLLLSLGQARSEWTPDPSQRLLELPTTREGSPVKVAIDYFTLDVDSIEGATETFHGTVYINLSWRDERMAFNAETYGARKVFYSGDQAQAQLATQWSPLIDISNLVDDSSTLDESLTINADGLIQYERRIRGTFSSAMALSRFPIDQQHLEIRLESFSWDLSSVEIIPSSMPGELQIERDDPHGIRGWDVISVHSKFDTHRYVGGEIHSRFISTVKVQRQSWFYMWDVVFPLVLVTFFALTCFFWAQDSLSERIAQVLTCMLTVTAQTLAVSDDLPKISYFTLIDYTFLLTYAVLLTVAIESIVVNRIDDEDQAKADRIDARTAWVTSIAYTAGMILIFVLAKWL